MSFFRTLRRTPLRSFASIGSLALALCALGIFGTQTVARSSLRAAAENDNLAHFSVKTTPFENPIQAEELTNVTHIDNQTELVIGRYSDDQVEAVNLVSHTVDDSVDRLQPTGGAEAPNDTSVIASPTLAKVGETLTLGENHLMVTVTGTASTTAWASRPSLFVDPDLVGQLEAQRGFNLVSIRLENPTQENLETLRTEVSEALEERGASALAFPKMRPDGVHSVEADIAGVSNIIGFIAIVGAIVAFVLLASTVTALTTDQTQDVAIRRALGSQRIRLRRFLQNQARGIALLAAVVGVPGHVLAANLTARIMLKEFAGITPSWSVPWMSTTISAGSIIVGAWLVSLRPSQKVVAKPITSVLRSGADRAQLSKLGKKACKTLGFGSTFSRLTLRGAFRNPTRSLALATQLTAGVAAAIIIGSAAQSVNGFSLSEGEPFRWGVQATPAAGDFPYVLTTPDSYKRLSETGIYVEGSRNDTDVEVYGTSVNSKMIDTTVVNGAWFSSGSREVVVAASFARRSNIAIGDQIELSLTSGTRSYTVVGTHRLPARAIFADSTTLASDLGVAGGNIVWAPNRDDLPEELTNPLDRIETAQELQQIQADIRHAVLRLFIVIGMIIVGVAGISMSATLGLTITDRRAEFGVLRTFGASSTKLGLMMFKEVLLLTFTALAVGSVAGYGGARLMMEGFSAMSVVDVPARFSFTSFAFTGLGVTVMCGTLTWLSMRTIGRNTPAATLRTS